MKNPIANAFSRRHSLAGEPPDGWLSSQLTAIPNIEFPNANNGARAERKTRLGAFQLGTVRLGTIRRQASEPHVQADRLGGSVSPKGLQTTPSIRRALGTRTTTGAFFTLVLSALLGSTASPLSAQQPIRSRYALSVDKSPADSTAPGRTNAETQLLVSSGSAEAEAVTPNQVNSDDSFPAFTLGSRGRVGDQDANAPADTTSKWTGTAITMGTSLTLVLGLFACFVLVMRRFGGAGQGKGELPKEVFSQLGGTAIDPRTRITMIRCGSRILVVSQTAQSTSTLCEITDMDEVQAITAACTGASQEEFMKTLKTLESTPSQPGFTDAPARQRSSPRRLFATA